jgi:hypothetical protein
MVGLLVNEQLESEMMRAKRPTVLFCLLGMFRDMHAPFVVSTFKKWLSCFVEVLMKRIFILWRPIKK